jgi:hypothetical protein
MRWAKIWAGLPVESRREACAAHGIASEPLAEDAEEAAQWLAETLHVRPQFLRRMQPEKRVEHVARRGAIPNWLAAEFLICLHHGPRLPLMVRFFDACGFAHDQGRPREEHQGVSLTVEALREGLRAVAQDDPASVATMLDCLEGTEAPAWALLSTARRALPAKGEETLDPHVEAAQTKDEEPPAQEPSVPGFTTLDQVLIDAVIAATAGQMGALAPDSAHDLVSEVVELNIKRHQSWFHLGFLDVLQGRPVDPNRPEANPERRAWYLAGAISARARRGEHAGIVEIARAHTESVRFLLRPESPAVRLVGALLFEAHTSEGLLSEGLRLLTPQAVGTVGRHLAQPMLAAATNLLHDYKAAEAAPVLDMLHAAVLLWPADGSPPPPAFIADLDRRRAHALRLRGDMEAARRILEGLLAKGASEHAARAHADLGLIASGHKALAHVEVPFERRDWGDKAAALRRGREHFEASTREAIPAGAHGDYCLGVLHLCEGNYAAARPHFERALAEMHASERVYAPIGTLDRARFYLAVCLTDALEPERAAFAAELLEQSLVALRGVVPMPLLLQAFENLGTMDVDQVRQLAVRTAPVLGDRLLAAVEKAGTLHQHEDLLARLAERMRDPSRQHGERVHDAEAVLGASLRCGRPELGADALDVLEGLADDRQSRARLLALLERRERYDPAWTYAESRMTRVRLLESEGRFGEAQALLQEAAHEALSAEGEGGLAVARGCLQRIRNLGQSPSFDELAARIEAVAAREERPAAQAAARSPRGRILFVGGHETQEQYHAKLREEFLQSCPDVQLDFAATGWSSNWGRDLPNLEKRVQVSGSVVLMQYMRTLLGRHLRAFCSRYDRPWVACTGHGYGSMRNSIREAIALLPG